MFWATQRSVPVNQGPSYVNTVMAKSVRLYFVLSWKYLNFKLLQKQLSSAFKRLLVWSRAEMSFIYDCQCVIDGARSFIMQKDAIPSVFYSTDEQMRHYLQMDRNEPIIDTIDLKGGFMTSHPLHSCMVLSFNEPQCLSVHYTGFIISDSTSMSQSICANGRQTVEENPTAQDLRGQKSSAAPAEENWCFLCWLSNREHWGLFALTKTNTNMMHAQVQWD